jgi:hypothetical protein
LIVCGIYTTFFSKCAYFSLLARAWELAAGVLLAETEGESIHQITASPFPVRGEDFQHWGPKHSKIDKFL